MGKNSTRLAIGTAQFGLDYGITNRTGQIKNPEVRNILSMAYRSGIDTLDTAIAYGNAEENVGQFGMSGWKVVSKLPIIPAEQVQIDDWIREKVNGSLSRLKVDHLYGLLLHRPAQLHGSEGRSIYAGLQRIKEEGLVEKIGVSVYHPEELERLTEYFSFDLVQAPLNVADRRLIDTGWMVRLAELGIELHIRSVFLQGLLLTRDLPGSFARWRSFWKAWDAWLMSENLTALEACLGYVLSSNTVSKVVIGVDNEDQFRQILNAVERDAICVPDHLCVQDLDLLDPSRWS